MEQNLVRNGSIEGALELTIISAHRLKSGKRYFQGQKLYVVAWVDANRKQKTFSIRNLESNPIWNQTFIFDALDPQLLRNPDTLLQIHVISETLVQAKILGSVFLSVRDIMKFCGDEKLTLTSPLWSPGGKGSTRLLKMAIKFYLSSDICLDNASTNSSENTIINIADYVFPDDERILEFRLLLRKATLLVRKLRSSARKQYPENVPVQGITGALYDAMYDPQHVEQLRFGVYHPPSLGESSCVYHYHHHYTGAFVSVAGNHVPYSYSFSAELPSHYAPSAPPLPCNDEMVDVDPDGSDSELSSMAFDDMQSMEGNTDTIVLCPVRVSLESLHTIPSGGGNELTTHGNGPRWFEAE